MFHGGNNLYNHVLFICKLSLTVKIGVNVFVRISEILLVEMVIILVVIKRVITYNKTHVQVFV